MKPPDGRHVAIQRRLDRAHVQQLAADRERLVGGHADPGGDGVQWTLGVGVERQMTGQRAGRGGGAQVDVARTQVGVEQGTLEAAARAALEQAEGPLAVDAASH